MAFVETLLEADPLDAKFDDDGDLYLGPNGAEFTSGIEGVTQLVGEAIRLFKEEWFLNLDKGMPWFQEILGEKYDETNARRRLMETILDVPGMVEIISLEMSFDATNRKMTGSHELRTQFGDTEPDTFEV